MTPFELVKRSVKGFMKNNMTTYAAALAYSALFALFPFLIFLIALLGFLQIPGFFTWLLDQAQRALPGEAYTLISNVVGQIQNQPQGGLLSFGIIAALWSASSGVRSIMNAMNVAYDVEETRPIWKRYPLSVAYTLGFAALLILAAALMILGPQGMQWLADHAHLSSVFVTLWTWLRFPLLAIILMIVAALIYYVAPNVKQPFTIISPGAVIAVVVWLIASIGFSIYVSNFANYASTYGSLGGIVVMLFYFYISAIVLLLGAEINAVLYQAKLGEPVPKDGAESDQDA
ncbi:MAG: YihY/virulence factor BrkB family protein [Thermomicrobiales bacterium]